MCAKWHEANVLIADLSHNFIPGLYPTVFGDNSYATELRLDYNYLTTMEGVPLDNQVGLKVLNVSHNQVSSFIFVNWTKLLRVSKNEFYIFTFPQLLQLTYRKLGLPIWKATIGMNVKSTFCVVECTSLFFSRAGSLKK